MTSPPPSLPAATPPLRRRTLQRLLIGGLMVALLLAAARLLAIQGWWRPVRVVSGSMAERLLGEHYSLQCFDCGFEFRYGVESPPRTRKAVCPNCGFATIAERRAVRHRGDRVLIDRAAYLFQSPRRFDLVAFQDPNQPARLVVKRIIGLPGEQVAIRHGDLYVNGSLVHKSLAEFRKSAILVHDQRWAPQPQQLFLPRWRPDGEPTGWQTGDRELRYVPHSTRLPAGNAEPADSGEPTTMAGSAPVLESWDWLAYHHWRCFANPYPRSAEAPVADNLGYNQGESRELLEVTDLVFEFRTVLRESSQLAVRVHDGREWFFAWLNAPARRVTVRRGREPCGESQVPVELLGHRVVVAFGRLDRQIVLAIGGQELVRQPYETSEKPFQPVTNPVGIGGRDQELTIADLRVLRDVYYLDPWSVGQRWETPTAAGPGQYVMLGDNPAISEDSRKWPTPWLPRGAILGRVLPYAE